MPLSDTLLVPSFFSTHCSPSDHFRVFTKLSANTDSFLSNLKSFRLITHPSESLGSLLIAYNTTLDLFAGKYYQIHQMSLSIQPLVYSSIGEYLDHPQRVLGCLYHCAKFCCDWCSTFGNMKVSIFGMFALKTPIHAQILGFWRIWPLNGVQYQQTPGMHTLARYRFV